MRVVGYFVEDGEHVLVACVREDDDGEGGEGGDGARPFEHSDGTSVGEGVAFKEMCYD